MGRIEAITVPSFGRKSGLVFGDIASFSCVIDTLSECCAHSFQCTVCRLNNCLSPTDAILQEPAAAATETKRIRERFQERTTGFFKKLLPGDERFVHIFLITHVELIQI